MGLEDAILHICIVYKKSIYQTVKTELWINISDHKELEKYLLNN